eukprot:195796-Alexandrium_andersonii.AAC.1
MLLRRPTTRSLLSHLGRRATRSSCRRRSGMPLTLPRRRLPIRGAVPLGTMASSWTARANCTTSALGTSARMT